MSFCKLGNEFKNTLVTTIENTFIKDYLPFATPICVKVYLYGLYKCQQVDNDITIEEFAEELDISVDDVKECFYYWQGEGLVSVIDLNPIEIIYLPCKGNFSKLSKVKEDKYNEFVICVNSYFDGTRQVLPTEIKNYVETMEVYHIDQLALLRIIKYCIEYKDKTVGYPYIIQVAKNWANEGIKNLQAVEAKIEELGLTESKLLDILKVLGIKRSATLEERQLYIKWTKTLGFTYETIMCVAKNQKRKGGMQILDSRLNSYFEKRLFSEKEIEDFEKEKQSLFDEAKLVVNSLGLYYATLDNVVDTYIIPWKAKGFDDETLVVISNICFKSSIRTLEGMNNYIQKLFKKGITSLNALNEYIFEISREDSLIQEIFDKLGISRKIKSKDRELYKTWTEQWNFTHEVLLECTKYVISDFNALNGFNKNLSNYYKNNVKTIQEIEDFTNLNSLQKNQTKNSSSNKDNKTSLDIYNYTDDELIAMFDNLDEVEI